MGDFTPLHSLSGLTTLDISGMEIGDVELEELQEALPQCAVISDEPVTEVREITLGGVTFKSDVTELGLSGLGIDDISDLAYCEALETLDLSGVLALLAGRKGFLCQYDRAAGRDTVWSAACDLTRRRCLLAEGNPGRTAFREIPFPVERGDSRP